MSGQIYCTLSEVCADLDLPGVKDQAQVMRFIRSASQWLEQRGTFLPIKETRLMDGSGMLNLWIDPILSVTSIKVDGTTLAAADYVLMPQSRMWRNGPYSSIEMVNLALWPSGTGMALELLNLGVWPNVLHNQVEIIGRWGLYDATEPTGAYTTQTSDDATLAVDNAQELSPGFIALVDAEHEQIDSYATPIDSGATVNSTALDAAVEIFNVDDATLLHTGEIIRIDFEQMRILDILSNTLLVTRGYNGTTRAAHNDDTVVYVYRVFNVTRAVNGTTAADHMTDRIYRVVTPDDINYLCRQMSALMLRKAQGGYAGKTGNPELGEVFYNDEFPKATINKILNSYRIPHA